MGLSDRGLSPAEPLGEALYLRGLRTPQRAHTHTRQAWCTLTQGAAATGLRTHRCAPRHVLGLQNKSGRRVVQDLPPPPARFPGAPEADQCPASWGSVPWFTVWSVHTESRAHASLAGEATWGEGRAGLGWAGKTHMCDILWAQPSGWGWEGSGSAWVQAGPEAE